MMREIIEYPDPILTTPCREITFQELQDGEVDGISLVQLVNDMASAMRGTDGQIRGVGLAAPQVGIGIKLCIIRLAAKEAAPLVLVNPVLSNPKGKVAALEGCLSLPGINISVKRPETVKVNALTIAGEKIDFDANGMLARVIQHECDHLQGVLILTRGSVIGRPKIHEQLKALEAKYERTKRWKDRGKNGNEDNAG